MTNILLREICYKKELLNLELLESIKKLGLINEIIVEEYNKDGFKYKVIDGNKRCVVFDYLGLKDIICDIDKKRKGNL